MPGQIKNISNGKDGAFVYETDGKQQAEMVYSMAEPAKMVILHTEVDEELKGQNIGKSLLAALIAFVRKEQIKVVPVCPFANAMFKKNAEWRDVLV